MKNYNQFGKVTFYFKQSFECISSVLFQALVIEKRGCKYCKKQVTTLDNGNLQSSDQRENKLNSAIIMKCRAHIQIDDKIIKICFIQNKAGTIKKK